MFEWNIKTKEKNHFYAVRDNNFIDFKLNTGLSSDYSMLFDNSRDMSEDGIIFIPNIFTTPDNEVDPIIGESLRYVGFKCVEKGLVTATIINTNIDIEVAKTYIELMFV